MNRHFFAYLSRMKFIRRWGLMRNTLPENDLEHAAQAAMIAHAVALMGNVRYGRAYDPDRIMAQALYHDAGEVITGDMPTPVKHHNPLIRKEYAKLEDMAAQRLLSMLPPDLRPSYEPLLVHDEAAADWRIVKAADRICAYIKCLEEHASGNGDFDSARASIRASIERIDLPEVRDFMAECVPSFGLTLDELSEG